MPELWIRYKAIYTSWGNEAKKETFESVEQSISDFTKKIEDKLAKNDDYIKKIDIESIGVE